MRLIGQVVKTPPSHGGIRGSTPLWVIFQGLLKKQYLKPRVIMS